MNGASYKRCLGCDYILDHLTEPRCPECGRGFDPLDPGTYRAGAQRLWAGAPWVVVALVVAAGSILVDCVTTALFYPVAIGAVAINLVVFVRSLVALVDHRTRGAGGFWVGALAISLLHLIGCGGALVVCRPLWTADLQP